MEDHLNEDEQEKLRLENEIRKIKLSLETGAQFVEDPDMAPIPPELENEFLNYIEQFETMNEHSPKITVYDKIGKPSFKKANNILDKNIQHELEKLLELLHKKAVAVDSIYDVDDREMYRFITEDLFNYEMYDMMKIDGMFTHFTYEEFYPNDEEDIKKNADDFYTLFFDLTNDHYKHLVDTKDNSWFEDFRNAYTDFETRSFEIIDLTINDEGAVLHFTIDFLAFLDERQTHQFIGKGIMYMHAQDYWTIRKVELPNAK